MGVPNTTLYQALASGYYMLKSDRSGPYVWDGTRMRLVDAAFLVASASFVRPADVVPYSIGDAFANSTAAGSVAPLEFTVCSQNGGGFSISKARFRKSGTSTASWYVALDLFTTAPVPAAGDNAAYTINNVANFIGTLEFGAMMAFSDGAASNGVPKTGSEITGVCASDSQKIYGLARMLGAATPASGSTNTFELETYYN